MLLWLHNPDFYATADLSRVWSEAHADAIVVSGDGYDGKNGLSASDTDAYVVKYLRGSDHAGFAVGCRIRVDTLPAAAQMLLGVVEGNGTVQVCVSLNTDGTLSVWRGAMTTLLATSTETVTIGTDHRLGFKGRVSLSTGEAEVHLDSTRDVENPIIQISDVNTEETDHGAWQGLLVGLTTDVVMSHMYALDGSGTVTGLLHDLYVKTAFPAEDGDRAEWDPNTGTLPEAIDDPTPDDDTTYIEALALHRVYSVAMDSLDDAAHVYGAQLNVMVRNFADTGLSPSHEMLFRDGDDHDWFTGWQSAQSDLWKSLYEIWDRHPGTNEPFTMGDLNAAEFGGRTRG